MNTHALGQALVLALGALLAGVGGLELRGQGRTAAYDVPVATNGNQAVKGLVVGNDFYVLQPITVWELGVFDHQGDGIQGEAVLAAQLFARNGNDGTLLETRDLRRHRPRAVAGRPAVQAPASAGDAAAGRLHHRRVGF